MLLVLGTRARLRARELVAGPGLDGLGALITVLLAAMVGWWSLAAATGDSWRLGTTAVLHLVVGVCLAWAMATALDARGVTTAFAGLVLGLAAALVLLAASLVEMLPYNEPIRILGSRLSLFERHPNQIAPVFTIGACLMAPLALRRADPSAPDGHRLPRWAAAILCVACLIALVWTQSRGATLATLAGLAAALCAARGWLPRRPLRFAAIAAGLAILGAAAFVSPLGDGLRAALEARTQSQSAIGQRYHLWRSASAAIAEHPWLGLGPSQYYAHARYAVPSYYDGNVQDAHPHNLFLAAAESAGLPGLIIVVALLACLLELGRRRVLAARAGPERRRMVALFAVLIAVITANMVDLAQGGASLMPLFVWVALGLFAAAGRQPGAERVPASTAGSLAAWLALAPLSALPLVSLLALDWAATQPDWTAARICEVVRWLQPWNGRAVAEEVDARLRLGQHREALALAEDEARGSPARLGAQVRYGLMLLESGRTAEALALLERAQELDPLGTRAGIAAMALARVHAARGDEAAFRETFLRGLTLPGGSLLLVQHEPMPSEPGDPEGSRRVGFRIGGPDGHLLPAAELLGELGQRTLDTIATHEVDARRLLGRVVEGYLALGLANEALELVLRYRERAPEMFSITALEIDLRCKLGDYRGAAETYTGLPRLHAPLHDRLLPARHRQEQGPRAAAPVPRPRDRLRREPRDGPVLHGHAERAGLRDRGRARAGPGRLRPGLQEPAARALPLSFERRALARRGVLLRARGRARARRRGPAGRLPGARRRGRPGPRRGARRAAPGRLDAHAARRSGPADRGRRHALRGRAHRAPRRPGGARAGRRLEPRRCRERAGVGAVRRPAVRQRMHPER